MLVHEILDRAPASVEAVRDADGSWTYGELVSASHACANWLSARGVVPGDRVVVRAVADRRVAALLYGCSRAGAIFVPVHEGTKPYQLTQILADAEPALVVGDWELATPLPVWPLDSADFAGSRADLAWPVMFFYTSGSVAAPKAVVCPHAQVVFAAHAIAERLGYRAGDVVYCRLPLSFDYGLYQMLLCAIAGATLVLAGGGSDARLVSEVRRHEATVVPAVPALAGMLVRLAARDPRPSAVRLFTNTGEAMPAPVIAGLRERFPGAGVQLMFGLTECKRVSILDVDGDRERPGSVGTPLAGTSVRIVDGSGAVVGPGVAGEIVMTGPHVMAGYWRDPAMTARFFGPSASGTALHTGDVGHLDADGHLYFHGRRDHIFKRRGMRTSVAEIEAAALDVPGVVEAALVPPAGGQDAMLYVVGSGLVSEAVRRELRDRLDPAKVPDDCLVVTKIPHGPTGKVDRVALRGS
jgi:acyl-coenzyme A synthetase/AMP-(fatty) acid ligase